MGYSPWGCKGQTRLSDQTTTTTTTLMAESEEELKSLLMKVKEVKKSGLKLSVQKTKIMASGPITTWEIEGETLNHWLTLFFLAPKSLQMVIAAMTLKDAYSLEGKL